MASMSQRVSSELLAEHLEQPLLDDRSYRVIRLHNKLEATLIHDPDTDTASAAVDVNAGSLSDDVDLPGMAHAVEHMLFLGNEKYPEENDYTQYLSSHAGLHNAYTAQTSTNYYFQISVRGDGQEDKPNSDAFYGALDRFSQFFVKPLFRKESLEREMKAVDSENKKNLQSDVWRLQQLKRSLSNPKHPNSNFSTGNYLTLYNDPISRGVNVRHEFIKFYDKHYSANRMKLVVLGRESLDQLQTWTEELFAAVENKDLEPNSWEEPLLTKDELSTEVFATPVMDTRQLDIVFQYPDEDQLWEAHPSRYISHLIGHEGPGSILAYVKAKGWANDLSAGARTISPGCAVFEISISLTPEGLKRYRDIVEVVFQYISILRRESPQEWIFDETRDMAEVNFRYQQKRSASSTASSMASVMQMPLSRDRLLNGLSTMRKFDRQAIERGIASLKTDNFRLFIVSKEPLSEPIEKEKWYGTEYTIQKLPTDFVATLEKALNALPDTDLALPSRNEFIPGRLEVEKKVVDLPAKRPRLIRNDSHVRLWHKKDDQFWVPKGSFLVRFQNAVTFSTARNAAMTTAYSWLVRDALDEYSYDAELAGLAYNFSSGAGGLFCSVSGYSDKMAVLLEKVLSTARNLEIRPDRFAIIKDRLERAYKNQGFAAPYQQLGSARGFLMTDSYYSPQQYITELESISVEEVRNFVPLIFGQSFIEALAHGNLWSEDALKLTELSERIMKARILPEDQIPIKRSIVLPHGSNYVFRKVLEDKNNVNNAIQYIIDLGDVSDRKNRTRALLLDQMAHEPAFDQLRTKEQLGYVVFSGALRIVSRSAYYVSIQSERSPLYLEERIDNFLRNFKQDLLGMNNETFEKHRRSKINERLERLKNLRQETDRFMAHIENGTYFFEEMEDDALRLESISKDEMVEFFDQYIDPSSEQRSKISIHLQSQKEASEMAKQEPQATNTSPPDQSTPSRSKAPIIIEDVAAFKASLPLSRAPAPIRPLSEFESAAKL